MTQQNDFLHNIDLQIQSKHLLKHDFYLAWSRGDLSKECLLEYAKEYYHHVKAFPTYISAIHSNTEEMNTRRILLKNLMEEEAGSPNHPDLWRKFAVELGATEEEIAQHQPNAEIQSLIATFRQICNKGTTADGIAALYAYESQIPEICISKIDGLKKHYGMTDPKGWEYFLVHIAADKEHAEEERELLKTYLTSKNQEKAQVAAGRVLDALWNFLTGLCHKHQIACA